MSLEDAVEEYSRKWKVSKEEAEKEVLQILKKTGKTSNANPEEKKKTPTPENIFPEPIGELSKKVQDINQAALSTFHTRRLLNTPPEDIAALRARIEGVDAVVGELKTGLEAQIKKVTDILEDKQRKETREELLKELEEKMNPLKETLQSLAKKIESGEGEPEGKGTGKKVMAPDEILDEAEKVADKAKKWLQKQGYKVEPEKLSKSEVQKMVEEAQKQALANLSTEELRKRLEQDGYKVVGGPISWDQVEKMLKEERRRAQEELLEDKRVDAVKDLISDSIRQVVTMFQPAVQLWMNYSLQSRAEAGQKPPETKRKKV